MNLVQIIGILRQDEALGADEKSAKDAFIKMHPGYHFFLSRKEKKQRKGGNVVQTTLAFGPFDHSHIARFIETSAFALGLVQSEPIPAAPTLRVELESRQPALHCEPFECESKIPPRARIVLGRDLIAIH